MLKPKKIKFEKQHRGRMTGKDKHTSYPKVGKYFLQAKESQWISAKQIESTRRTIIHKLKREGKLSILFFPHKPVTTRVSESRMGSGKGNISHWVAVIKSNMYLFALQGITKELAYEALKAGSYKLPIKTQIIIKYETSIT